MSRAVRSMTKPTRSSARFPLRPALLGIALAAAGILLLSFAVDSMTLGKPITRAWVAGVAGVMLLVPGVVVAAHAVIAAFSGDESEHHRPNGPAPLKFS